jgi:hypothetical protein
MKIKAILMKWFISTMILFSCSGTATSEIGVENMTDAPIDAPTAQGSLAEVPEIIRLMVWIDKLEDTDLAVSPQQAGDLLPLLKAYRTLSTSDTAAQAEVDAVLAQLLDSLSAEQDQAIEGMQITQADMFGIAQERGFLPENGSVPEQSNQDDEFPGEDPPFGGIPAGGQGGIPGGGEGGGFPGAGPGRGFGGDVDPEAIATARAERGGRFANRAGLFLLDPLIEFLEIRAGA